MNIKLDALRTFITVADCGTLAEASKLLNRAPSAVSMSLKQFEDQLGGQLFETDRKSVLSPLGHFVLEEGRRALGDFDESMRMIQRYVQGEMGTVRVAAVPSVATRLLPGVVQTFRHKAPQVRLELRDMDSPMVATAVRNGSVDVGIAGLASAANDLQSDLLLQEPFGVVCWRDHPLTQLKAPVRWQDLQGVALISNGLCNLVRDPSFVQLREQTLLHVHNNSTLLSFVERQIGVTLLPRMALPLHDDTLCFLSLADEQVVRRLYFFYRRHYHLTPVVQAFMAEVRLAFAQWQ